MSFALVTGAAKGIGKAIAEELALRKYNLLLVDMDADALYATSKKIERDYVVQALPLHIDISSKDGVDQVVSYTQPYHEWLSVVVNNAGYGLNGAFENIPIEEQLNIIEVNINALVKLSHAYIPVLKKFEKGYLLNVSSTTAYQTVPYLNVYAATKAFALSFTRGLSYELRSSNLTVSTLSLGSTGTDFVTRADINEGTKKIAAKYNMTPEAVAQIAISGLFKGKPEIIPGFANKLNAFLPKFFPKWFVEKITGNIYKQKNPWIDPAPANIFFRLSKLKHQTVRHQNI